jgi:RND family efflux transporter MFP subunit
MKGQPAIRQPGPADAPEETRPAPLWHRAVAGVLKALLPLAILAGAVLAAREIWLTAPVAGQAERPRVARLVEVAEARPAASGPVIEAWGAAEPARTLVLRSEIAGRVIAVHENLSPGGIVEAGETLIRLDDREQRLALAEAEAEIRRLEAQIAVEEGQQARAARDLERLSDDLTDAQRALVLREPQMRELEAQRDAAEARRDAAAVALEKTRIAAPFDALVRSEEIAEGTVLGAGAEAARLVAADRFRVTLAVPPAALDRLDPEAGLSVRLTQPGVWPGGAAREGRVAGVKGELTGEGRMAELIVEVADPLARAPENAGLPSVLIGAYLRGRIEGAPIPGAVTVERAWLRDGDTVWVMTEDRTLDIRALDIAWRGPETVLATGGIAPGERVVTTRIAVVAEGMNLRTRGEDGDGGA